MWVVSTGTALTHAGFAVHQSILYTPHNKKVHGNTAYLKCSINREFTHTHTHTHTPNEPVTHGFLAAREGEGQR
jgi:hypothetical protein